MKTYMRNTLISIIITNALSLSGLISNAWAYHTDNGRMMDENNHQIIIDGVNWAGFQDAGFVDELYGTIPFYSLAKPYQPQIPAGLMDLLKNPGKFSDLTNVKETNSVSFKTIRLPINPNNLHDPGINNHFRMDLTDARNKASGNGPFCKIWNDTDCTQPLSITESLYQIIDELKKNNIRVLVDFHQTPSGRNGNVVTNNYSLHDYQNDVAELAKNSKVKNLDNVLGIDVFNEPHNLFWFSENGDQPAWVDVIAAAASAVYQNNPDLLLFVEGPSSEEAGPAICIPNGQIPEDISAYSIDRNACGNRLDAIHFKSNWGENFRALLDADAAKNGEFKLGGELRSQLLKRLPVEMVNWLLGQPDDSSHNGSHLVFSPHIYGSHVATWQSSPEASPYRFNWNFGFLQDSNYSVVIGETGYLTDQVLDVSFFKDSISPYLIKKNMNHQLFYWTFNSNSGDTGGIRENANTAALVVDKERALHDLFYYKQSSN